MAATRKPKKSVKKAAKKVAKKSPAKKSAKKSVAKKSTSRAAKRPAKKVAKKSAKRGIKKSAARNAGAAASIAIPEVPTRGVVSPSSTPAPAAKTAKAAPSSTEATKKKGSGPFFFILIGVLAVALIFASQSGDDSDDMGSGTMVEESTSQTSEETEESEESTEEATEESTEETTEETTAPASYDGPTGIVAQYTNSEKSAATIFWKAPASTDGITGYAIQIQRNGGSREDLSSTPSTQFTLDITKSETSGWTSFIVQTVYSDGTVVDGKVFGLPGQWN